MAARLALFVLLIARPAAADILNVPADFPTIQAAIDSAQDGDEIVLAPGVYAGVTTLDRPLQARIRSSDPDDPAVVKQTIMTNTVGGQILVGIAGAGETIAITLDGLTIRRDHGTSEFSPIEFVGSLLDVRRCILDGGAEPGRGIIRVRDGEEPGEPGSLQLIESQLVGFIGAISCFELASADFLGCSISGADTGIVIAPGESGRFRMSDCDFADLQGSGNTPVLGISLPSGTLGDLADILIERVSFRDTERLLIESNGPLLLSEITVERVRRNGGDIMRLRDTIIDGMVIRDSGGLDGDFGLIQANVLHARNVVAQNNFSQVSVFHVFGNGMANGHLIESSRFENNTSRYAVVEVHGGGTVRGCEFLRNTIVTPLFGGAPLVNFGQGRGIIREPVTIEQCVFIANTSEGSGAIACSDQIESDATITVRDSTFAGNTSLAGLIDQFGVNFANAGARKAIQLVQCEVVGNRTGTGLYLGATRFVGCTLAQNSSSGPQLGIGDAELFKSIFVPEESSSDMVQLADGTPAVADAFHSVVPTSIFDSGTTVASTTLDPLFIRPPSDGGDGWGDDPATPDIDESLNDDFGDLRLRPGSPAIDAGSRGIIRVGETDLDGNPRLRNDPGIPDAGRNGLIDIGAYEFQGVTCLPDVNQDGLVMPSDFNAWILAYNAGSPLADQNRDGAVTPSDFNAWILNYSNAIANGCP